MRNEKPDAPCAPGFLLEGLRRAPHPRATSRIIISRKPTITP